MTGTVELDPGGTHLLIRFPYREDLVAMVKELPGRRWDPKQKVWRVPAKHVEDVYAACSRHLFEFAAEIPSLLAGTLEIPKEEPKPKAAKPQQGTLLPTEDAATDDDGKPQALTISELNQRVKGCIGDAFPQSFWIVGEVVDFDKSAGRDHRFFQLAEKMPRAQRSKAVVDVALFGRTAATLLPALEQGNPPMTLRDGIEIRALVRADFYPATGRFQVIVNDIDPSFTLGKIALTKEQILRELADKGLAERNRSLGLPVAATRIGVLTSPDADGWNDFRRHLEESGCGFDVTLFPVKVQGADFKSTMIKGLQWFAERAEQFDVLCILRGGGSRTDLAWFDDREVALQVAQHPLKVVVGIGHQRDQSVLDLIAHSEKTPTAVAELLARSIESAREYVTERGQLLAEAVTSLLRDADTRLHETVRQIARSATERVQRAQRALASCGHDLAAHTSLRLSRERATGQRAGMRLVHAGTRYLERKATHLDQADTRRRLLDPKRVLQRGFAIVRGEDDRIAPSIARIAADQRLRVQFRDGTADVHVDSTHSNDS